MHCDLKDGKNWLRERVLSVFSNKQFVVDMYETTMPLKSAVATIDFKPTSEKQSEVTFTMEFVPTMGLLGKLMAPMMKMKFKPLLQSVLDGNAAYIETGQQTNAQRSFRGDHPSRAGRYRRRPAKRRPAIRPKRRGVPFRRTV